MFCALGCWIWCVFSKDAKISIFLSTLLRNSRSKTKKKKKSENHATKQIYFGTPSYEKTIILNLFAFNINALEPLNLMCICLMPVTWHKYVFVGFVIVVFYFFILLYSIQQFKCVFNNIIWNGEKISITIQITSIVKWPFSVSSSLSIGLTKKRKKKKTKKPIDQ